MKRYLVAGVALLVTLFYLPGILEVLNALVEGDSEFDSDMQWRWTFSDIALSFRACGCTLFWSRCQDLPLHIRLLSYVIMNVWSCFIFVFLFTPAYRYDFILPFPFISFRMRMVVDGV